MLRSSGYGRRLLTLSLAATLLACSPEEAGQGGGMKGIAQRKIDGQTGRARATRLDDQELLRRARIAVEEYWGAMVEQDWAGVIDRSWYPPQMQQALDNARVRRQMIDQMSAEGAAMAIGLAIIEREVIAPRKVQELAGGRVLLIEVSTRLMPRPGLEGTIGKPELPPAGCVSEDGGATWRVAAELGLIRATYPN